MSEYDFKVGDMVAFKNGGSVVYSNFGEEPYYQARIIKINGGWATVQAIGIPCKMQWIPLDGLCKALIAGRGTNDRTRIS